MRTYGAVDLRSVAATPAVPVSDAIRLYAKAGDGKLYTLNAAGVETVVGSGAGGGGGSSLPVGTISMWAGANPPPGSLICDGSTFQSTTYPDLALVLGDTYGTHSGTTYFLPDLRARVPIGVGSVSPTQNTGYAFPLAMKWGNEQTTLTAAQLPKHAHGAPGSLAVGTTSTDRIYRGSAAADVNFRTDTGIYTSNAYGSAEAGTQTPFPNHQPVLALNFIIKALADPVSVAGGTSAPMDSYSAVCTTALSVSTTLTDIAGMSFNVTSNGPTDKFLVLMTLDAYVVTPSAGTGVVVLLVDGVQQTTPAVQYLGSSAGRQTVDQHFIITGLSAGIHAFKCQASTSTGATGNILIQVNSRMSAVKLAAPAGTGVIGATGFRNALRNGDFSVAQRGNGTFTAQGYGLDGWTSSIAAVGFCSVSRNTLSLTDSATIGGAKYEAQCVVAGTAAAGDYSVFQSVIEDVRTLAGKQVTLSFWAYGSVANKIGIEVQQNFGTGGSPSATAFTTMPSVQVTTTGWAKYSTTFTVPSVAGKTAGTNGNDFVLLNFWLSTGSTYAARGGIGIQNWTVHLADVQLEEGATATNFERIPVQQQLAWCQRYFYRWLGTTTYTAVAVGTAYSTVAFYAPFRLPVPMRVPPSAFGSSVMSTFYVYGSGTFSVPSSLAMMERTTDVVELNFNTAAGIGVPLGGSAWLRAATAGSTYLDFTAEL